MLNESNVVEFSIQNQTLSQVKLKLDRLSDEHNDLYELVLPKHELSLGPKDDTVDYKHVPLNIRPLNEETQITFQSVFKIGFFIRVIPKVKTDNLAIELKLDHDVLLLQSTIENENSKRITQVVRVQLGPVE